MAPLIATWNEAYDIDGFGQSCRSFRTAPPSTLGTASTDDSYRALISGHARLIEINLGLLTDWLKWRRTNCKNPSDQGVRKILEVDGR
jgi:hypothetical protein